MKYMEEMREKIRKYENRALYQSERTRQLENESVERVQNRALVTFEIKWLLIQLWGLGITPKSIF